MLMSGQGPRFYTFGPYRLDPYEKVLFHEGRPLPLTPKALDTLLILVGRHGHLVGKDEIMRAVWRDAFVEENNLTQNISTLRRVLGDADGHRFIETVPRRGYRFVAEVTEAAEEARTQGSGRGPAEAPAVAPAPWLRFGRWRLIVLVCGVVFFAATMVIVGRARRAARPSQAFARMRIAALTSSGNVTAVALSPDGRYLALAVEEGGRQALWVRQLGAPSGVRVVPPAETEYWGLTFSPNGQFVYYVSWEPNRADAVLFRVPLLGGAPQRLPSDIASRVTFSPDGSQMAYLGGPRGEDLLIVANANGTEPRTLASRRDPDAFVTRLSGPAWSPDGSTIVVGASVTGTAGRRSHLLAVRVSDGVERVIGSTNWASIGRIVWVFDGRGLVLTAGEERWAPRQIWYASIPEGAVRHVTNDVDEYRDLSITADASTLVALQTGCVSTLWIAPAGQVELAKRIWTETGKFDGIEGMSWTPDGQLVYRSRAGGSWDLWQLDPERPEPRQLTFDPHSELHPSISPDGGSMIFVSDRSGRYALYRMALDGGDTLQITDAGDDAVYPAWVGDGRSVVFQAGMTWFRPVSIWKIAPGGGRAQYLAGPKSIRPAVSPDGRLVAYFSLHEGKWVIRTMAIEGGPPTGTFSIPPSSSRLLRWMPDGRAVAYIVTVNGVSNVWKQPLTGGPPQAVTDFKTDLMFDFAWSRNGRLLAVLRAVETSNAVRITEFR
jgi:Tol biopolymer transport system component/DNA-binding winged helix-turn-helix (wHTH) protein